MSFVNWQLQPRAAQIQVLTILYSPVSVRRHHKRCSPALQGPVQARASIARRLRVQPGTGPARGAGQGQAFMKDLERRAASQYLAGAAVQPVLDLTHFFRRGPGQAGALRKVLAHRHWRSRSGRASGSGKWPQGRILP